MHSQHKDDPFVVSPSVNSGEPCRTIVLSQSKGNVTYAGLLLFFIYLDCFSLHHITHINILFAVNEGQFGIVFLGLHYALDPHRREHIVTNVKAPV